MTLALTMQPMAREVRQIAGNDRLVRVAAMEAKGVGRLAGTKSRGAGQGWVVANPGSPLELTSSRRCNVPMI
jgi:hypothetical protein